ncbi:MAG: hypothetical protein AAF958_11890 [Planctomycetota bacterium]
MRSWIRRFGIAGLVGITSFVCVASRCTSAGAGPPLSKLNRLGRWCGVGYSDGYHTCATRGMAPCDDGPIQRPTEKGWGWCSQSNCQCETASLQWARQQHRIVDGCLEGGCGPVSSCDSSSPCDSASSCDGSALVAMPEPMVAMPEPDASPTLAMPPLRVPTDSPPSQGVAASGAAMKQAFAMPDAFIGESPQSVLGGQLDAATGGPPARSGVKRLAAVESVTVDSVAEVARPESKSRVRRIVRPKASRPKIRRLRPVQN